ncbi:Chaperone SurA [Campylobacter majalis]|uniref:Chaperone SurA n=1 Tax=Campylobacter majalis TaxID=2790656 RepID=A0ABN7K8N8_9BACT|nr:peptidylprolyl isomerase [Campylobacter majalis]CAD7288873.1 Chaperone SurA [Campylobacter majalis]
MVKKLFLASIIGTFALSSELVNGIAAIIENEAITLYEIERVKKELNVDKQRALDLLIRDRLEQAQIKNLGIVATQLEINQRIDAIARQNGMSMAQFRDHIEYKQGVKFTDFKNDIQKSIQQEKLYKNILSEAGKNIDENSARNYYEANINQFTTFSTAEVTLYRALDADTLQKQIASGTKPINGVQTQNITLDSQNIPPQLVAIISATQDASFTGILKAQNGFDAFYVKKKSGLKTASFQQAKNQILNQMHQAEQDRAAHDYFEKLKSKSKLNILR